MFYNVDILNPRTGKFGLIWLAAHGRLGGIEEGLTAKRKKSELRDILRINIKKSCRDIQAYLRGAVPSDVPGEDRPRLSLYLSAMLTYGTIYVWNKQVKALLNEVLSPMNLPCVPRANPKISEISCKGPKRSKRALKERPQEAEEEGATDFGEIGGAAAMDVSSVSSGIRGPGFRTCVDLTGSTELMGEALIDWLLEPLPELQGDIVFPAANTVPEASITLREADPVPKDNELEMGFGDFFGFEETRTTAANRTLLNPQQEEEPPGQSELLSSTSALLSDLPLLNEGTEDDLAKGTRRSHSPELEEIRKRLKVENGVPETEEMIIPEQQGEELLAALPVEETAVPNPRTPQAAVMELEPLNRDLLPAKKVRTKKPKKTRLIIDMETSIPAQAFARQRENYESTLRVPTAEEDRIYDFHYGTIRFMMKNPGRKLAHSQLLAQFQRNLVTLSQLEDSFEETNTTNEIPVMAAEEQVHQATDVQPGTLAAAPATGTKHNVAGILDTSDQQGVPVIVENLQDDSIFAKPADDPRAASARGSLASVGNASQRGSLASVANASRVSERTDVPAGQFLATLEALVEKSAESYRSNRLTLNEPPFPVEVEAPTETESRDKVNPIMELMEIINAPKVEAAVPRPVSVASGSGTAPKKIQVVKGEVLVRKIRDFYAENCISFDEMITFRQLVPPTKYTRAQASKIFANLIELTYRRTVRLTQDDPRADVFITLIQ